MRKRTSKLNKLERNRFSILQEDTSHCINCNSTYQLTWHEIYEGRNRQNSMRYGLCLRICLRCHQTLQDEPNFNEYWHIKGQQMFEQNYDEDFLSIFKRNYL